MTGKADFSAEEWELVASGPPSAGMIVVMAQRGGTFRESLSMAKSYTEARRRHGESQLLDEIAGEKPEVDHTRFHSLEELKEHGFGRLRDALALLDQKAAPEEVDQYKAFVVSLSERVAEAHREGFLGLSGERVSDAERNAVNEIASVLGVEAPGGGGASPVAD